MNKSLVFLLMAGTLPAACNTKSPEQTGDTTATATAPAVPVAAQTAEQPDEPPAEPAIDPAALQGESFAAFDLLANRPLAHSIQGSATSASIVADAGAQSFARYIQGNHAGNWSMGIELEGRKASAMRKVRNATIWLPAPAASDSVLQLEVFNPAKQPNKLTVTANGTKLETVSVDSGWQTVKVSIPAAAMRAENALELGFSSMGRIDGNLSGAALGKVRLGPASDLPITFADVAMSQDALTVSAAQGGAMWHLWALDSSRLKVTAEASEECSATVVWSRAAGEKLVEIGRKPVVAGDNWVDFGVKDDVVRVSILAPETGCEAGVKLASASLVLAGEKPTVPAGKAPKQILFWMIDTLRADHLPIHFETDVQAPNLKRLADEGASFAVAYVQGNESKTSHASLFSGMYPSRHNVLARGHLKPHHHLMSEAMGDNSYKSYAFISNGYVSEPWGFVQGWDMYRNNLRSGFGITAGAMVGHTLEWMTKHKGESMFMYVGTIDPHVTYRRHKEFIGLYDDEDYKGKYRKALLGTTLGEIATKKVTVTDREKDRIRALYKNEITYNDQQFGELRKGLEELGTWDETMVIVTGDHGDQFWEHGGVGHGSGVHQEVVHVPLIIHYPPLVPKGTKVQAGADVLDIYPTMLDAIDAKGEPPADLQGKSLLELIHGVTGDYPEPAIATHYKSRYGVQMRQWKMVSKKGSYQFFDRAADPNELTDVAGKHPLAERWVADTFSVFRPLRDKWKKAEFGAASNLSPEFLAKAAEAK